MSSLTLGSLFSGIGGLDLGLERAGMEVQWQVEIEDYCTKILEKHWPDVRRYRDVKECKNLPYVDVIAGGFPCQPVSVAGKRKVQADSRWLWPEFSRIVSEVRPRYVIVENVPGLLTSGGMGDIFISLAQMGYDAEWGCVSAASVGAPHLRKRIFIVAYPSGEQNSSISNNESSKPYIFSSGEFRGSSLRSYRKTTNWLFEPNVGRVAHGIPSRVDRLISLGNAVTPQQAECIGKLITER